ncbi:MAG: hypothetical protein IJV24_00910, partial [Prevotella sp.]|nr:hypothetical protein [Prevotella sp.]
FWPECVRFWPEFHPIAQVLTGHRACFRASMVPDSYAELALKKADGWLPCACRRQSFFTSPASSVFASQLFSDDIPRL